jgi:hypothetical protein
MAGHVHRERAPRFAETQQHLFVLKRRCAVAVEQNESRALGSFQIMGGRGSAFRTNPCFIAALLNPSSNWILAYARTTTSVVIPDLTRVTVIRNPFS